MSLQTQLTVTAFPGRYVQGPGAVKIIPQLLQAHGVRKLLVISDHYLFENVFPTFVAPHLAHVDYEREEFCGEVTLDEAARITGICKAKGCDAVLGMGGGKAIDVSRAVAFDAGRLRVFAVPTVASTDAPCSARTVFYTASGEFVSYRDHPLNPTAVIMDTEIIVNAPVRTLVSGMGDALSTYFEAESCRVAHMPSCLGFRSSMSAQALARLCYTSLLEYGEEALLSARRKAITPAFEHIVETNTLLSGLGFESCGLAAAHAIHNGLCALPCTHSFLHGEKVTIGVLAGLFLTDRPKSLIEEVYAFCAKVGLPLCLSQVGLPDPAPESMLRTVAERTCAQGESIFAEDASMTPSRVMAALLAADEYGRRLRDKLAAASH